MTDVIDGSIVRVLWCEMTDVIDSSIVCVPSCELTDVTDSSIVCVLSCELTDVLQWCVSLCVQSARMSCSQAVNSIKQSLSYHSQTVTHLHTSSFTYTGLV